MLAGSEALIAVIPARRGSVRLPGKNLSCVGGVSLIERSVRHAHAVGASRIIITTDDPAVRGETAGLDRVEVIERPAELATGDATTDDVILHVIDEGTIDDDSFLVLLQPTSPFRNRRLIEDCIAQSRKDPNGLALSMSAVGKSREWLRFLTAESSVSAECPEHDVVQPTGAVYAFRCGAFVDAGGIHAMLPHPVLSDRIHACDIDERWELVIAQALAEEGFGDDIVDI